MPLQDSESAAFELEAAFQREAGSSRPGLTTPGARRRMTHRRSLVGERCGDLIIAPGSQRPPSLADVTKRIIVPAVLDAVLGEGERAG